MGFCLSATPIVDGAIDAFIKFVKSYFKIAKIRVLLTVLPKLGRTEECNANIVALSRLINTFDDKSFTNGPTKSSIINSMDNDGKNVIDVVLELPFHYIDNILEFLGVFMPLTNAKLSSSIIKRLWTEKTLEKMCKWVAYSGIEDMFEDECQKYIIKHLICQEKCVASISRNEFDCLCQIFFILNDRYRRLSRNK